MFDMVQRGFVVQSVKKWAFFLIFDLYMLGSSCKILYGPILSEKQDFVGRNEPLLHPGLVLG